MKNFILGLAWMILMAVRLMAADAKALYENNFERVGAGELPDEVPPFLVLEGAFAVREENGNKLLELPGAPLETYGVLFGPTETNGIAVQARFYGTLKGRRFPTFAVGLNGVVGYRLQVSPAKKLLELYKGDQMLASAPFAWESGTWTLLRLQSGRSKDGHLQLDGKAWKQGTPEPAAWTISHADKVEPPPGRPSLWGSPFAGTPIRFDDLVVSKAAGQ